MILVSLRERALLAAGAALVLGFAGASGAKQAGSSSVNLYQDVMSHKASMSWKPAPAINYPDDACSVIDSCSSDGSAPKVFVLPSATVDGRRVGRAVYLVKIKDPKDPKQTEAVVFEHQTVSQTYFFRVGPDGTIQHTVYLESGKPWMPIPNTLGQSVYGKDISAWHDALTKPAGAAAPAARGSGQ